MAMDQKDYNFLSEKLDNLDASLRDIVEVLKQANKALERLAAAQTPPPSRPVAFGSDEEIFEESPLSGVHSPASALSDEGIWFTTVSGEKEYCMRHDAVLGAHHALACPAYRQIGTGYPTTSMGGKPYYIGEVSGRECRCSVNRDDDKDPQDHHQDCPNYYPF